MRDIRPGQIYMDSDGYMTLVLNVYSIEAYVYYIGQAPGYPVSLLKEPYYDLYYMQIDRIARCALLSETLCEA